LPSWALFTSWSMVPRFSWMTRLVLLTWAIISSTLEVDSAV
jgi:hypothetical protein